MPDYDNQDESILWKSIIIYLFLTEPIFLLKLSESQSKYESQSQEQNFHNLRYHEACDEYN